MQIDDKLIIDLWGGYLSKDGTFNLSSFDMETFKTFKFARNTCVKKVIWPQGIDAIPANLFSVCTSLEEEIIPNIVVIDAGAENVDFDYDCFGDDIHINND